MWEELLVTFVGLSLAFLLDRAIDRYRDYHNKRILLNELHLELEKIKDGLRSVGNLLYTDIWDSAISSGQVRLLEAKQLAELTRVYAFIKGTSYEAKRLRDAAEDYRRAGGQIPVKARVEYIEQSSVRESLRVRWAIYSEEQLTREKNLHKAITRVLTEKWWH